MQTRFRAPLPADYRTLASWVGDARTCARWAGPQLPFPFTVTELASLLQVEGSESFAMVGKGDELLGFGQYWLRPTGAVHLGRIIVSPLVRGLGLGKTLCAWLAVTGRERTGASVVTLRVYRDNPAAMAVYTSLGFEVVEAESDPEILLMQLIS
ncbi:GNAT family N-acetyltransferase [Chitinimonas naiadis]